MSGVESQVHDEGQGYWKDRVVDLVVEMLFKEIEVPPEGASREAAWMEQVTLPGLFALVEE